MDLSFLSFVGEPWFVISWYAIGAVGTALVIYDLRANNTAMKPAMKWAWPIITFFFSVVGLILYVTTARPPGIADLHTKEEKQKALDEYESNVWRRTNGAVIHCVAGDGLGIMVGMVIARATGMSFWQEFWFEYAVGFAFGWFIFQWKSMAMMTDSVPMQLAMAFRAEFFSMLTVMAGMGAVMTYVTPMVATAQPKPLTFAFWGFGMFGLLVGYVFTYPMNWMLLKIGWKHGMGSMEGAKPMQVEATPHKAGLFVAMTALGAVALLVPAWLTHVREASSRRIGVAASSPSPTPAPGGGLAEGVRSVVRRGASGLQRGDRSTASPAMDAALRAAEAGAHAAPTSFEGALEQIRKARRALQQGSEAGAIEHLQDASELVKPLEAVPGAPPDVASYRGAKVIDARGAIVGEVASTSRDSVEIALGGWRDAWGFVDLGADRRVRVPADELTFGPRPTLGDSLVVLPQAGASVGRSGGPDGPRHEASASQ